MSTNLFDFWHQRLGHPSIKVVKEVLSLSNVHGVNNIDNFICRACCLGKIHKFPFYSSQIVYDEPLRLIYCDIWGPSPSPSRSGYRYYISFVYAFSKFTLLFLLRQKSEAREVFKTFKSLVELQFNHKIKVLQSDWGEEFRPFSNLLSSFGILHRHPCLHAHAQNGAVECQHRYIVEHGLVLLAHYGLSSRYWDEAFRTATLLYKRIPTPILNQKSHFEVLFFI